MFESLKKHLDLCGDRGQEKKWMWQQPQHYGSQCTLYSMVPLHAQNPSNRYMTGQNMSKTSKKPIHNQWFMIVFPLRNSRRVRSSKCRNKTKHFLSSQSQSLKSQIEVQPETWWVFSEGKQTDKDKTMTSKNAMTLQW